MGLATHWFISRYVYHSLLLLMARVSWWMSTMTIQKLSQRLGSPSKKLALNKEYCTLSGILIFLEEVMRLKWNTIVCVVRNLLGISLV
ncbi:hypothetical protein Hanom_Chr14g01299571 [Helianthus anomalus]